MPYSTLEDLLAELSEDELIQLTDDAGLQAVDTGIFEAQRDAADAEIDGYLTGGGYDLPLLPVPLLIRKISRAITSYNLHRRRLKLSLPESLTVDYRNQVRLLEAIQAGKVSIGVTPSQEAAGTGAGKYRTNKTAADREFGKDRMKGY